MMLTQNDTEFKLCARANLPSLVSKECDRLAFTVGDDRGSESLELPMAAALEILGDTVADAGGCWYLRRLEPGVPEDAAIMQRLHDRAVEGPQESAGPYKKGLLHLAEQIAKSSGGLFSKVSKAEARSMEALREKFEAGGLLPFRAAGSRVKPGGNYAATAGGGGRRTGRGRAER